MPDRIRQSQGQGQARTSFPGDSRVRVQGKGRGSKATREIPVSEAIRTAAEAASCQFFAFSAFVFVSCIDLFPQKPTGGESSQRNPEILWRNAFLHLDDARFYNPKFPAIATDLEKEEQYEQGKYRGYLAEALATYVLLAKTYPDFHPDLVWERMRDVAERLAYE